MLLHQVGSVLLHQFKSSASLAMIGAAEAQVQTEIKMIDIYEVSSEIVFIVDYMRYASYLQKTALTLLLMKDNGGACHSGLSHSRGTTMAIQGMPS